MHVQMEEQAEKNVFVDISLRVRATFHIGTLLQDTGIICNIQTISYKWTVLPTYYLIYLYAAIFN